MTGESLSKYSDEICVAMHSQNQIVEEKHGYKNKNGLILPTGQWYAPSAVINVARI